MSETNNFTFVDKDGLPVITIMDEEWRDFGKDSYSDTSIYQVSSAGRVRRICAKGWKLVNTPLLNGNLVVVVSSEGKQKTMALKKVVASTWVENPRLNPDVYQIDGDKMNVNSSNLAWYDYKKSRKLRAEDRANLSKLTKTMSPSKVAKLLEIARNM